MRILDLKYRARRNGSEVTVIFDDESVLALDAELAVRFRLERGMIISPEKRTIIEHENDMLRARQRLIRYLAMRKKSSREAATYLKKAGFNSEAINAAIEAATQLGYLHDSEFAEAFIRTRIKAGKKGARLIAQELLAKGINREEAQRLTETMIETKDQVSSARQLAAKKFQTLKDEEDLYKASRKLQQFLARKGFSAEICEQISREFFGDPTIF